MVGGIAMDLKIIPRISEKTYAQAQAGMYVFDVPKTATKAQITDAVAKRYDVKVVDVNTVIAKGKVKQSVRKGGARVTGRRNDVKKAYVRLAEGATLPFFTEASTEEKK
jgi:large subunit ribosomal protein L23